MTPTGRRSTSPVPLHYVSGNYPVNLYGPVDTRNECWGNAEAQSLPIQFKPPAGQRVRVLELRGDLTAWPKTVGVAPGPGLDAVAIGSAGVLLGFSTTGSAGATECNFCADGCMVYVQAALVGNTAVVRDFDYVVSADNLLDEDNILVLKLAAWLNTTGVPIHVEGTYGILFQFE